MNDKFQIPEWITSLTPYKPGKPIEELAREFSLDQATILKLASNENPLGMSPAARATLSRYLTGAFRYPDGDGFDLKTALCSFHGNIRREQLILGNGSNDVLDLAARVLLQVGRGAVFSQYAFLVYPLVVQAMGAQSQIAPATRVPEYGHDLAAMAQAITGTTRIVFIANPNNPTGSWLPPAQIKAFLERMPQHVVLILDEAYDDYLPPQHRSPSLEWLREHDNLLITRTFSKIYGLAGLRVGYGIAHPDLADILNRVRQPFNVSSIAQAAACSALADRDFVQHSYLTNRAALDQLTNGLQKLKLSFLPSMANFITAKIPDAAGVYQRLLAQGVIVRPLANYGLPDYLRITTGSEAENQRLLSALEAALR